MAGDIFYSEVDKNLKAELNARALAGSIIKDNAALDFNLTKITNVQVTAFNSPKMTDNTLARPIDGPGASPFAILGGSTIREGNYVPTSSPIANFESGSGYLSAARKAFRIPPVITLCDINIGDGSMGLLNKASINVLISDPTADLDEFEHVWFRPGRHVLIEFEGNKEQIVTRNRKLSNLLRQDPDARKTNPNIFETFGLLEEPNTRTSKIFEQKYSPEFLSARKNQIRNMNKVLFDGVLTSFTFSYQGDGTIDVNLQFSGTSNVYTDVELLLPTNTQEKNKDATKNKKSENSEVNTFYKFITDTVEAELEAELGTDDNKELAQAEICFNSVYGTSLFTGPDEKPDTAILVGTLYPEIPATVTRIKNALSKDKKTQLGGSAPFSVSSRYIQLGLLIRMLNNEILSKLESIPLDEDGNPIPDAEPIIVNSHIICDTSICKSSRYDKIVSSDPHKILLYGSDATEAGPGFSRYPDTEHIIKPTEQEIKAAKEAIKKEGNKKGDSKTKIPQDSEPFKPVQLMSNVENRAIGNNFAEGDACFPSRIFINIFHVLKPILEDENIKTANQFLKAVATTIKECTGGAISLALITDPVVADQLIFYDRNYIGDPQSVKAISATPFTIPMGAKSSLTGENSLAGSIVTDLKLSSKLPADLQSLAFTLNQGTSVSSTAISAFTSFMYAQGKIGEEGSQKDNIAKSYAKSHAKALKELEDAKALLTNDFTSHTNKLRLRRAIKQYLKFPTDNILDTNVLNAPIYPFDAEITIEGISGFKYGDVVEIPILPKRYKTQTVFSIIGIDQTVDASGQWSTKIKLIMRPKIT